MADTAERATPRELDRVIIRFAGDSGDGMQLTGDRFTSASALFGNDLATLPEFPAEIRAPAGTLAGVSAFQVHISDHDITTPGDAPNVLVAMNPAALHAELGQARAGRHAASSTSTPSTSATWPRPATPTNPLTDGTLKGYNVYEVPMTSLTKEAVRAARRQAPRRRPLQEPLRPRASSRGCTPGPSSPPSTGSARSSPSGPQVARRQPGRLPGRPRLRRDRRAVRPPLPGASRRPQRPGTYTNITGNTALAWGLVAAGQLAQLPVFLGSLPDHPGVGHPPRAVQAQELRRPHPAGRGRDRRHRRRPRRLLRRPPRASPPPAARAWPSSPRPSAWPSASSCRC